MFAGLFALLTKALGQRTGNVNREESRAVLKRPYLYFYWTGMAPSAKRDVDMCVCAFVCVCFLLTGATCLHEAHKACAFRRGRGAMKAG